MHPYFFDSYALIEIIKGNSNYERFMELPLVTSTVNIAEVYYYLMKELNESTAKRTLLDLDIAYTDISFEDACAAAAFRYQNRKKSFSYIDCIGYIIARSAGTKFLTGDGAFKNLKGVEFVL